MAYELDISLRTAFPVDTQTLRAAVLRGLEIEQVTSAVLSISIVDDRAIHILNRDHLQHDYPTDVISFQLDFCSQPDTDSPGEIGFSEFIDDESDDFDNENPGTDDEVQLDADEGSPPAELRAAGASIEGEIVASAEMANSMAVDGHWSPQAELTLYVIHGMLHICGYDDLTPDEKNIMRSRERAILSSLGMTAVYPGDAANS